MVAPPVKDVKKEDKDKEEPLQIEITGPDIKQIIRGINVFGQFGDDQSQPIDVINDYIRSYLVQGYKLVHTQHLRTNMGADGTTVTSEQMLYVLVKDE